MRFPMFLKKILKRVLIPKKKHVSNKCECCDKPAIAVVLHKPLCTECILYTIRFSQMIIKGVVSDQRKRDLQTIEDLEKRLFQKKG